MKNVIAYYYQLFPDDIHQIDGQYKFEINQEKFCFVAYERDLKDISNLYEIETYLLQNYFYCHLIVLNVSRSYVTYVNGSPYVLLKIFVDGVVQIGFSDVLMFHSLQLAKDKYFPLLRNQWRQLWSYKIDYFEYQINQFGKKYPLLRDSFSYFVGVAENCISLLQNVSLDYVDLVVSHYRIHYNDTLFDFYNPLNFIVDTRVRDVCEYFKDAFFRGVDILDQVIFYLNYVSLTGEEYYLFFVRMLFPSYYFDLYEDVVLGYADEECLLDVIGLLPKYEVLLREIYWYIKKFVDLPVIEWLIKT